MQNAAQKHRKGIGKNLYDSKRPEVQNKDAKHKLNQRTEEKKRKNV